MLLQTPPYGWKGVRGAKVCPNIRNGWAKIGNCKSIPVNDFLSRKQIIMLGRINHPLVGVCTQPSVVNIIIINIITIIYIINWIWLQSTCSPTTSVYQMFSSEVFAWGWGTFKSIFIYMLHHAILLLWAPALRISPTRHSKKRRGRSRRRRRIGAMCAVIGICWAWRQRYPHCLVWQKTLNSLSYFASTSIRPRSISSSSFTIFT